jgi:TRAP-type C4-dicarboxylate transport system substrate-binding protein
MKRGVLGGLIFAFLFNFEVFSQPKYVIKMGTLAPEGSTWMNMWKGVSKWVEEKTKGDIKFVTYPGGVMGDEPDMVRKLKLDQLQMGGFTVNGIYMIAPEMLVLELPFLFRDYGEVNYVRKKLFDRFNEFFLKRGFVLIAWIDQGLIRMYTKERVENLEQLRKQKMWVWAGEPVAIQTFKAWGVNPIPSSVPEALSSLQTGLVNAIYTSPLACVALQWYTQIKYIIDLDIRYEPAVVVENKSTYDKTPKEYQKYVREAMEIFLDDFLREIQQSNVKSLVGMYEQGIKPVKWSEDEVKKLEELSRKVWYDLADKLYPRELLEEVIKTIEEYRREVKK